MQSRKLLGTLNIRKRHLKIFFSIQNSKLKDIHRKKFHCIFNQIDVDHINATKQTSFESSIVGNLLLLLKYREKA